MISIFENALKKLTYSLYESKNKSLNILLKLNCNYKNTIFNIDLTVLVTVK